MHLGLGLALTRPCRASAFDPASLSPSVWLTALPDHSYQDAGKATPADEVGDDVYTAADRSGNGNDWTQATASARPTMQKDAYGNWVWRFDGVDDLLSGGDLSALFPTAGTLYIRYGIHTTDLFGSDRGLIQTRNVDSYYNFGSGNDMYPGHLRSARVGPESAPPIGFGPHTLIVTSNASGWTLRIDGAEHATGTAAYGGGDNWLVGLERSGGSGTRFWPSDVYEIIAVDRVLTADEIAQLEAWSFSDYDWTPTEIAPTGWYTTGEGYTDGTWDNREGTAARDLSQSTEGNRPTQGVNGLDFDRTRPDWLEVDAFDPGAGAFSVYVRFQFDSLGGSQGFVVSKGNDSSGNAGWSILVSASAVAVRCGSGGATNRASQQATITSGTPYSVCLVLDRTSQEIIGYLNGSNAGWTDGGFGPSGNSISTITSITNANPMVVAGESDGSDPTVVIDGWVSDLLIFDKALTQAEILQIDAWIAGGRE